MTPKSVWKTILCWLTAVKDSTEAAFAQASSEASKYRQRMSTLHTISLPVRSRDNAMYALICRPSGAAFLNVYIELLCRDAFSK